MQARIERAPYRDLFLTADARMNSFKGRTIGDFSINAQRDLSRAAGSILGDEAMHWAILRQALGEEPVPSAFVG